jgi:hypothetical protein
VLLKVSAKALLPIVEREPAAALSALRPDAA